MAEKIRKWHKKNLSQKCVNQEDLWNLLSKDIFEENIYYPTPIIPLKQSFFFSSFEFVLKNIRRPKNKYGYNFPFQVLPFNQPQNIPIGSTLIEYGSMKLKIERVFIFVTTPLCKKNREIWPENMSPKNRAKWDMFKDVGGARYFFISEIHLKYEMSDETAEWVLICYPRWHLISESNIIYTRPSDISCSCLQSHMFQSKYWIH